ncbi:hypothetical protein [Streptacidiphilus sp. PAMC 29251]
MCELVDSNSQGTRNTTATTSTGVSRMPVNSQDAAPPTTAMAICSRRLARSRMNCSTRPGCWNVNSGSGTA